MHIFPAILKKTNSDGAGPLSARSQASMKSGISFEDDTWGDDSIMSSAHEPAKPSLLKMKEDHDQKNKNTVSWKLEMNLKNQLLQILWLVK